MRDNSPTTAYIKITNINQKGKNRYTIADVTADIMTRDEKMKHDSIFTHEPERGDIIIKIDDVESTTPTEAKS